MADLINLAPPDMSELDSLAPFTFTVQNGNPVSFVGIWVRYEGSDEELLVRNGTDFVAPFIANSTIIRPLGDDTLVNYSIVPEGGWQGNLARVRVQGFPLIVIP